MYVVIAYLPIYAIVKARSLMTLAINGNGDIQVYGCEDQEGFDRWINGGRFSFERFGGYVWSENEFE